MMIWIFSFLCIFFALPCFQPLYDKIHQHFLQSRQVDELKKAIAHLRLLKECLESGLVPEQGAWKETENLAEPWGSLFSTALYELRNQGAPVLPSLQRMVSGLEEERELASEARMKSAQAFGQVLISVFLVPFFGGILYLLLPNLSHSLGFFCGLLCFCLLLSVFALFWMLNMMENARYGCIPVRRRPWILSSKIFFEKMFAEIHVGHPPDLAWSHTMHFFHSREPDLLEKWGLQVWQEIPLRSNERNEVEAAIVRFGVEIRRAIQHSLTEGSGVMDRLEAIHRNYLFDLKVRISRELQVLPNHCLKPLFILVLPAVMLLLFGSLAISFGGMIS